MYIDVFPLYPSSEKANIILKNVTLHHLQYPDKRENSTLCNRIHSKLSGFIMLDESVLEEIDMLVNEKKADVFFFDRIPCYEYYCYLRKKYPIKKLIYISHNAEALNFRQEHLTEKAFLNIKKYIRYLSIKASEERIIRTADYVFSISNEDTEWFREHYKCKDNLYLCKPLISFKQLKFSVEDFAYNIVFVGSMFWYPNIKGIAWFCDNVFSRLLEIEPKFKLYVVGKNPHESLLKYKR